MLAAAAAPRAGPSAEQGLRCADVRSLPAESRERVRRELSDFLDAKHRAVFNDKSCASPIIGTSGQGGDAIRLVAPRCERPFSAIVTLKAMNSCDGPHHISGPKGRTLARGPVIVKTLRRLLAAWPRSYHSVERPGCKCWSAQFDRSALVVKGTERDVEACSE